MLHQQGFHSFTFLLKCSICTADPGNWKCYLEEKLAILRLFILNQPAVHYIAMVLKPIPEFVEAALGKYHLGTRETTLYV